MVKSQKFILLCLILFFVSITVNCGSEQKYFTLEDFPGVEKIDAHVHVNSVSTAFIKQAQTDNFKIITINVDYPDFPSIEEQFNIATKLMQEYPNTFAFASTFHLTGWDEPGWQEKTIKHIDSTLSKGAIMVKVWKNIGMDFRDKDSNLVMIDDQKFDVIFEHLSQKNIPLIGHLGEPKNCWLPFDEMTTNNDREYFKTHPQYHMYMHPEFPSYEEQMAARDRMLEKNSQLRFMGAHLASLEWSVDKIAEFLDKFPNAVVDMAARMIHLQFQSSRDRYKVRNFLIKYQNRILYATDNTQSRGWDSEEFKQQVHKTWLDDWKYMVTTDTLKTNEFEELILGLKLPKKVVEKIYRLNAEKMFPEAWKE